MPHRSFDDGRVDRGTHGGVTLLRTARIDDGPIGRGTPRATLTGTTQPGLIRAD